MSPTSEPRRTAPRVRARAKASASEDLRPEVAEALGGLQRSLGEVTDWEHLLSTTGEDVPAPTPADVVITARVRPQVEAPQEAPVVEPVAPVVPVEPAEAVAPVPTPGSRRRARRVLAATPTPPPAVPPPLTLPDLGDVEPVAPLPHPDDPSLDVTGLAAAQAAAGAFPEPNLDLSQLRGAEDPMATWVEHTSSPHRFGLTPEAARRRRNGRLLSWAGAVLLVAAVAYLLIPDRSTERPTLVPDRTTTSTTEPSTTTSAQFGSQFSVPTLPPTTAPAVVTPTPTTVKSTKRNPTTSTTRAPSTTAPPATAPPVVTTTTQPPPTTTTTATTIPPPVTCPPVPGQRPGDC